MNGGEYLMGCILGMRSALWLLIQIVEHERGRPLTGFCDALEKMSIDKRWTERLESEAAQQGFRGITRGLMDDLAKFEEPPS